MKRALDREAGAQRSARRLYIQPPRASCAEAPREPAGSRREFWARLPEVNSGSIATHVCDIRRRALRQRRTSDHFHACEPSTGRGPISTKKFCGPRGTKM